MCERCGQPVKRKGNRFCSKSCSAHAREVAHQAARPAPAMQLCACGCGTSITVVSCFRVRQYVRGHNNRRTDRRFCEWCDASYPARRRGTRFCSRACSSATRRNDSHDHRRSPGYRRWRLAVLDRDGYRCQDCGQVGGILHAHHIDEFARSVELRLVVSNGRTLCVTCHSRVHGRALAAGVTL